MKNLFSSIILFVFLVSSAKAQDFNNYKPLVSEGIIPKEFLIPSSQKYKKDIAQISKKAKNKEKKTRKQFALETNFILDDMLQSGLVIFNDKITLYLNEVVNNLVEPNEPKLSKLKVYTLRSSAVNAFATGRGEVFVTLGLLAQMENEAQLAFILCHELTHIQEQHSLEFYLETHGVSTTSSRDVLKKEQFDKKLFRKHNYSKELETEADEKGLTRFLKTKYSTNSIKDVFDVLKYSYLPFDDVPFDYNLFQSEQYVIPTMFKSQKVKTIGSEKENKENDEESTHPNISKRKEALKNVLKNANDAGKSEYVVSKERFQQIQQIARFELPHLHLKAEEYANAVYVSYLLLKKYPNSIYLKKSIAKALYYSAKYHNSKDFETSDISSKIEGESQQIHYLLEKIPSNDIAILAMRYAWLIFQDIPNDSELKTITKDLATIIASKNLSLKDFSTSPLPKNIVEEEKGESKKEDVDEKTKLEKIRKQSNKADPTVVFEEYWHYAFSEFLDNNEFVKTMEEGIKKHQENNEIEIYYNTIEGKKAWAKYEKRRENGLKLGIDKIVIINPFYKKIDVRGKVETEYIETEEGQVNFKEIIKKIAPKSSLKVDILDISNLTEKQINQMNDIRFLNDWFSEQVDKFNLTLTPCSQQAIIDSIAKGYSTDFFLWTGVVSIHESNKEKLLQLAYSVFLPPFLPLKLVEALQPNYEMLYFAILYDVKTGKREVINFDYFYKKDTNTMLKSHLYDTFTQIKTKDSKEKIDSKNTDKGKKK
jgi:beta-barrel assembly-enhancing protease